MLQPTILVFSLLVLLLGAPPMGTDPAAASAVTPGAATTDAAGLIDIGGRRLWLECRGTGSPTVILEAGYPDRSDVWDTVVLPPGADETAVLPAVAAFTRVCVYDRPGTVLGDPSDPGLRSRSDPVPQPRTAADLVADLHVLLEAAEVPGPYVLVGHSLGGLVVRLYAATYPADVAGLVLVDASHEDQSARLRALLTDEQWAMLGAVTMHPPGLEVYPDFERIDLDDSSAQMRGATASRPLRPMPAVILSHGRPYSAAELPPDTPPEAVEQVWRELQTNLVSLVPGARHVIATKSGHYIHIEQPALVTEAVREVVMAVRDPSTWVAPNHEPATPSPQTRMVLWR